MSKMTTFVPLTKLRPFKDNWRIQVKCLHSWKQNTPFAGDTFEMVLADQWGNKIHATSKRSLMLRIQRVLPIDSWGVIEHVTVTPAGGQYRTTNYKYKMVIAEDAVLSRSDLADDRNFLSLANYEEIENGTKKQAFLIDVIGRIHELGDVQTVQVSGEDRKRVQFRLVDAEGNNLACCLWGTYAEQLEPFAGKDQTIICLIRFAKIKEFREELQITNAFDASRLFLNPMIPELAQLTERLSNDDLSVALVQKPSGKKDGKKHLYNWNDAEIKTISEAAESTQVHFGYEHYTFVVLEVCSGDKVLTIETDSQSNSDMVTTSSTMSSGSVSIFFYLLSVCLTCFYYCVCYHNSQQVFECSSLENTDTENGDSDLDDHMDYEPEVEPNNSERVAPNSEHIVGVVKAPKPPNQKCFSENEYLDEGDPDYNCSHCGAIMWYGERLNKRRNAKNPTFSLYDPRSRHFQRHIRPYNMVFSFTSLGGRVERSLKKGRGPDMFQLQGENYHLLGAGITPPEGSEPKFGQLYIVDTENEVENRAKCLSLGKRPFQVKKKDHLRKDIIETLMKMLNEVNPYVKKFRSARDRFNTDPENSFHMRIVSERLKDGRTYNTPTASEVAALIPGDFSLDMDRRDIVLQKNSGKLLRINEIHASYLALQYPLLFTYGEDGFRLGIKKGATEKTKKHKKPNISMRQWFAFRLHERKNESHSLLHSRRLFQQFVVDAFTTIESNRLRYLKLNQPSLRSDSYDSIKESENAGKVDMNEQGTEFTLPASFVGSPRYMKNCYLDAMAICKHFGFPDFFITFTCNPKWPEITRYVKARKLKAEDRSDIICRIFKIKLDSLMDTLTKKNILGETQSCKLNM
ncbi:unnamed protein product, partial [Brassica rapa subsp. trilocularis]